MNKLKLELELLEVQTFEAGPDVLPERGTIRANAQTMENCFTFDDDTCDCTDGDCDPLPPTVNMMDCNTWAWSCRGCGSGPGPHTGDPWNLTCS